MREFQQHLVRAGALAKLESVLRDLQKPRGVVGDPHRTWFAELLHPFAEGEAGRACSLRPSSAVPPVEGGAILSILLEDLPSDRGELEARVRRLAALRDALLRDGDLGESEVRTARDIATQLRRHFVGKYTPSAPRTSSLA